MRIRKHAKISPLFYASSSSAVIQTRVCQLNQSPWDVITFPPPDPSVLPPPPPPFLVDKDYTYLTNGTSQDHTAAYESPALKEKCEDTAFDNSGAEIEQDKALRLKEEEEVDNVIDAKGMKCKRKAKNGQYFSEQNHLSQVKNHSTKKKSEIPRRPRQKKQTSSSNPYEFYYYSGFGPRWGKKRGLPHAHAHAHAHTIKEEEPYMNTAAGSSSETCSKNNNNIIHEVSDEGPNYSPGFDVKYSSLASQIDKDGLDYVEDDDDADDGELPRKRARKPIKARSLKSLM